MAAPILSTGTVIRGLALPATKGPGGYFAAKDPYDTAWGDLLFALFTEQGSRPMRRSRGSGLHRLLFAPLGEDPSILRYIVQETAARDLPHLNILKVTSTDVPKGRAVTITFGLKTLGGAQERVLTIPKSFAGV